MAKEKSGSSAVVLRGSVTQGAANAYVQTSMLTGLSAGGNDALLVKEIVLEVVGVAPGAAAITEMEFALTRATKAAMVVISDDDLIWKNRFSNYYAASFMPELGLVRFVPQVDLVLIEDTVYFSFDSSNLAALTTAYLNVLAMPATVTESEKVGILLSRLN